MRKDSRPLSGFMLRMCGWAFPRKYLLLDVLFSS